MTPSDAQGRLDRILAGTSGGADSPLPEPNPTLAERRRLHRRGRFRWYISLRALTTTALCLVALLGAWWAVTAAAPGQSAQESPSASRGSVEPIPSRLPMHPSPATPSGPASGPALIVVHVSGAVKHPGIVRLPAGVRVFQAIDKAGGALDTAELDALNLAEPLQDGRKIHVPQRGERMTGQDTNPPDPGGGAGGTGPAKGPGKRSGSPAAPVDLNTASEEQLMTLPRVGKVLADRILAWREQHGSFTRIDDLDAVDGIGPRLLEQLTPLLVLGGRS
ncbi:ComEA family DNA-binding protein [Arthrobacter sp. Y-9]|uniref:ComEA family DNA-binding protein n=1 Tax=Arthrobacter sp. Y-9 TaxID=3039385 RepID=UPI00241C3415|nr:ComEA family DNA-binding protein [Arthrobacter sp. Y-9]WFR85460.1 ComEA family DNA-binding protein [Arthrobacter sp. Y-9]